MVAYALRCQKTEMCATTLYGVTMQENGTSKPIPARFVDVGENGEILDIDWKRKAGNFPLIPGPERLNIFLIVYRPLRCRRWPDFEGALAG